MYLAWRNPHDRPGLDRNALGPQLKYPLSTDQEHGFLRALVKMRGQRPPHLHQQLAHLGALHQLGDAQGFIGSEGIAFQLSQEVGKLRSGRIHPILRGSRRASRKAEQEKWGQSRFPGHNSHRSNLSWEIDSDPCSPVLSRRCQEGPGRVSAAVRPGAAPLGSSAEWARWEDGPRTVAWRRARRAYFLSPL